MQKLQEFTNQPGVPGSKNKCRIRCSPAYCVFPELHFFTTTSVFAQLKRGIKSYSNIQPDFDESLDMVITREPCWKNYVTPLHHITCCACCCVCTGGAELTYQHASWAAETQLFPSFCISRIIWTIHLTVCCHEFPECTVQGFSVETSKKLFSTWWDWWHTKWNITSSCLALKKLLQAQECIHLINYRFMVIHD